MCFIRFIFNLNSWHLYHVENWLRWELIPAPTSGRWAPLSHWETFSFHIKHPYQFNITPPFKPHFGIGLLVTTNRTQSLALIPCWKLDMLGLKPKTFPSSVDCSTTELHAYFMTGTPVLSCCQNVDCDLQQLLEMASFSFCSIAGFLSLDSILYLKILQFTL